MGDNPFPKECELNKDLELQLPQASLPPGQKSFSTIHPADGKPTSLPGQPLSGLDPTEVSAHLHTELLTNDLNRLAPYLWLVGTQQSSHISPLHQQIVKGREIIITENIELHCTWIYDRVFIKPVPPCLLSWAFWQHFLVLGSSPITPSLRTSLYQAALGYLRTYSHLIKHASDFRIAKQQHLLPEDTTYEQVCEFFAKFRSIPDNDVSPRYEYGELRLGRLNFWAKIFLRRFAFQKVQTHYAYNVYFARFYGPIIFLFAFATVVLSAMQVDLTVNPPSDQNNPVGWRAFGIISRWFAVFSIACAVIFFAGLLALLTFMAARETTFALRKVWLGNRRKLQQGV